MERAGGTPVDNHAIQVDISPRSKPASIFHKYGGVSDAYENTMFENDLVMIFPLREGGEIKKPDAFTAQAFVDLLLGKDTKHSRHPFQRVLRTPRCFLDEQGNDMVVNPRRSGAGDTSLEVERQLLEAEYEKFVGSTEPTTERRFCELVATAISRRVQLACGLTTRMFLSCDGDEIIMSVKSENDDLRVEADRTNYRLQLSNKPFDDMLHRDKIHDLKREIGADGWQSPWTIFARSAALQMIPRTFPRWILCLSRVATSSTLNLQCASPLGTPGRSGRHVLVRRQP